MGPGRSFVRASALALALAVVVIALGAGVALAQSPSPTPTAPDGICSPWHRCLAFGVLGLVVLTLGFTGLNFMLQRRGFDSVEHRMGNPDGVPVERK